MTKKKINYRLLILIAVCVLIVALISALIVALVKNKHLNEKDLENTQTISDLRDKIKGDGEEISQAYQHLSDLKSEIETLESRIENLKSDSLYEEKQLQKEIEGLNEVLVQKNNEYAALEKKLEEYSKVGLIDINSQVEILKKLEELLSNPPKKVTEYERDTGEKDEKGNPIKERYTKESDAVVSVYYYDISNGYKYSYNQDHVFLSASLCKLPFTLSVLKECSRLKTEHDEAEAEKERLAEESRKAAETQNMTETTSLETLPLFTDVPDVPEEPKVYYPMGLDTVFTYTEDKKKEGSGVIKNGEIGKQYTYLELFDYLIRESDNVAFAELSEYYTYDLYRKYVSDSRLRCMMQNGLFKMDTEDAGKILCDTYDFIMTDKNYGGFLEEAMTNGAHKVMIPFALYSKKTAHKYGWDDDAYHDMAIVFDKHPYVVTFMSDLHQGGTEVDTYIREIIKLIDQLHTNFYKNAP